MPVRYYLFIFKRALRKRLVMLRARAWGLVCLVVDHQWLSLGDFRTPARPGFRSSTRTAAVCRRCGVLGLR